MTRQNTAAEIEVLGGGIFGLTVAYCLQKRGATVRLVEKRQIGAGASGGLAGALAPHTPDNWNAKKQFQFESLTAMADFWAGVDKLSGMSSGYGRVGRLVALETARELELAHGRVTSAERFWHGQAKWSVVSAGDCPDWTASPATGFLSHDTLSARMSPRAAGASLVAAFRHIGGEIMQGSSPEKGADAVVLCTGYEGLIELGLELECELGKGVKGQGVLLDFDAGPAAQLSAGGVYFVPHANGTLAVGSTSEIDWTGPSETDELLDDFYAHALEICPMLCAAKVLDRWAGVRPRGRRRAPILGRHPTRDRVFIANGGFKIGFGMAVKAGEVMADLVLNGQADIPEGFSVQANLA